MDEFATANGQRSVAVQPAPRWQLTSHVLDRLAQRESTPVLPVTAAIGGREIVIWLKLESAGAWGSIKDRTALALAASVAPQLDNPDATVIESTSGNLGTALAEITQRLGRRFIAVVDPNLSPTLAARMRESGAQLDFVTRTDPQGSFLGARLDRVRELLGSIPGAVWTDQYHNPANPGAHYRSTAPELLRQVPGADAIFVAVSTGGTLAGISLYMRSHAPRARMIAVDVPGSRVFAEPTARRLLTGIGASLRSSFLTAGSADDVLLVEDAAAIAVCHQLRAATGICIGGSSGAALAACLRYVVANPGITTPVCVCPDGGASYAATLYDERWLTANSVDLSSWERIAFRHTEGGTNER
jgi:cysteine synthase